MFVVLRCSSSRRAIPTWPRPGRSKVPRAKNNATGGQSGALFTVRAPMSTAQHHFIDCEVSWVRCILSGDPDGLSSDYFNYFSRFLYRLNYLLLRKKLACINCTMTWYIERTWWIESSLQRRISLYAHRDWVWENVPKSRTRIRSCRYNERLVLIIEIAYSIPFHSFAFQYAERKSKLAEELRLSVKW